MRSRNGNYPFTLGICSVILFSFLQADTYRIGYRAVVAQTLLVDERLHVSRAMTKCSGYRQTELLLDANPNDTLETILKHNSDAFFHYMQQHALHVTHDEKSHNAQSLATTTLTFPTHCFTVDFNNDFARIALIK